MKFQMSSLILLIFENRFVPFPTWSWTKMFFISLTEPQTNTLKNIQKLSNGPINPSLAHFAWTGGQKIYFRIKKTWKIRVVLISGFKWHLSGIACYTKYPTHLALFCKIEKSSTMHSESKLNRKRNFRFVRFLSQFPSLLYFQVFSSDSIHDRVQNEKVHYPRIRNPWTLPQPGIFSVRVGPGPTKVRGSLPVVMAVMR